MSFLGCRVSLYVRSSLRALFAAAIGQQVHAAREASIPPRCAGVHFGTGKRGEKGDLDVLFRVSCLLVCQIIAEGLVRGGNRTASARLQRGQHPTALRQSALRDRKPR